MEEKAPRARRGYVRCEVLMPALSYHLERHPEEPSVCVLAILTPEGPLALTLHEDAMSQLGSALLLEAQKTAGPKA